MTEQTAQLAAVLAALQKYGLLLLTDARLPSVAGLVAGEAIHGSWWAHPGSHSIFRVAVGLAAHPQVTSVKLVSGKVTFLHRRLWPALVAVAAAGEPWQRSALSRAARALLARVEGAGRLRTDRLPGYRGGKSKALSRAARELEDRMLVHGEEFHTESGAHAKWLESWAHWARRVGLRGKKLTAEAAKKQLTGVVRALNEKFQAQAYLPWERGKVEQRRARPTSHG
ncbi:MAG: hypothetical protein HY653_02375 [Acidobacteria bacterium]|nr:hypothetical protein [Acidobacteriota bacterium]